MSKTIKNFILIGVIHSILFVILLPLSLGYVKKKSLRAATAPTLSIPEFRIAVLVYTNCQSYDKAYQSLCYELGNQEGVSYSISPFFAHGESKDLRRYAASIMTPGKYDLVVSIGTTPTKTLQRRSSKLAPADKTPLIFIGARNPVENKIVKSLEKPTDNITGIALLPKDDARIVDSFIAYKPHARKVLVPYCSYADLGHSRVKAERISTALRKKGLKAITLPIHKTNKILPRIVAKLSSVDSVIFPEDDALATATDEVAHACREAQVTFVGYGIRNVRQVAPICYGINWNMLGQRIAEKVLKTLLSNKETPCSPVEGLDDCFSVIVNEDLAAEQHLVFDERTTHTYKRGIIAHVSPMRA